MNFNFGKRWQRGALVLCVGALVVNQWSGQQRVRALERELTQLRTQVHEFATATPVRAEHVAAVAHAHVQEPASVQGDRLANAAAPDAVPTPVQQPAMHLTRLNDAELSLITAGAGAQPPGPLAMPSSSGIAGLPNIEQSVQRQVRKIERGGVLLPKGTFQIEPTFSYTHTSSNRVRLSGFSVFDVIFIGEIDADQIDRDVFSSSTSFRYGVANRVQGELELSSQYQRQQTINGPIENRRESNTSEFGIGDVRGALFYQLTSEHGWIPALIGNLKLKAPTGEAPSFGNGTWATRVGLTMLKSSDPVVLFSNIGYTLNFPGTVNGQRFDPGDTMEMSEGLAYALNYNLSINTGFEQVFVGSSKSAAGRSIGGSQLVLSSFKTGLTYAISRNLSMDMSVGAGLTEDSPDVTVSLSFPYTF